MSNNSQTPADVVSPATSDQHWMRNPRCISCLARRLDIKDCPFYNVCPSCGGGSDAHDEHCRLRTRTPIINFFRLHPLEPGKNPWWKSLNIFDPDFRTFIPNPNSIDPLVTLLSPGWEFPPRTTLRMEYFVIRAAWDNEIWEYGITDPPDPPAFIQFTPPITTFGEWEAERQALESESQTTHSNHFKTHNTRSDRDPPRSLHGDSMLKHKGLPRDSTSVPTSLVAPGIRSEVQEPLSSDIFRPDMPQSLVRFPSSLASVAKKLVLSLRDGNHAEISSLDYSAQIQRHGRDALVSAILSFVHPTVFNLQGQELTPDILRKVQKDQLEGQSFMQWPKFGGYLDFVTDDRSRFYVRFYVGQSIVVALRLDTHCRHILQGAFDTLHYYILNMGDGHRRANWLQLWSMPEEMQYRETFSGFSISIIQCCLEMMFCRAFESLPNQTLAEYFGTALHGQYSGRGLNVLSPLLQPVDLCLLESSRSQHRSRLSSSSDPEVASWPAVRVKMIAKERQDAFATSKALPPSISAYGRLIQEQLQAQNVEHFSLNALLSKSRFQTEHFRLEYQFAKAFGESDNFHTLPFGSLEATVCVVLDNRHIDIGTKTSESGWIPWLLRSVGFHEGNALLFTYNHTYRGLYNSITNPEGEDRIALRRKFTRLLINNSNLRIVLLCGPLSRDEILASIRSGTAAVDGPYTLDFRRQKLSCWLQRHPNNYICRMFIESPEPFPVLLGSNWRKSTKLGEVFKIAVALTDIKVDAYHFESCSFTAKVLKKRWSESRNQDIEPWTPENLDPVVRHYLQRRGFTTREELEQLQNTNSEKSLTRALIVLLHCYRDDQKQAGPRKRLAPDHVKSGGITPSKHQRAALQPTEKPLHADSMDDSIRQPGIGLPTEAVARRAALQPTEKPLHADSMDDSIRQLDIGLPPSADAVQTLLEHEDDLPTYQSGIYASRSENVIDCYYHFDSDTYTAHLLAHGRLYTCANHTETNGRFFHMKDFAIKIPDGMNSINIRPELAPQGQVHPDRFIRKWLPELEPASRLAIRGWGRKEDGSDFDGWLHDTVGQKDHLVTAMRIFRANTVVDWLEGIIWSVSLRPRRYAGRSQETSSVEDFAKECQSKWR
ncbi:hypothetical protein OIDMADRAFT_55715 [Oidiodendron maius Zn]|uniref:Uncharacterized protein n=1 Tax=Oidiodendron maius (strain Zn) TaxID=913774 RepID=A0A0C3CLE0_OIDMZ|nr:hypothetical protein OIDMADRAFT_55715 [Oidiodendron maius Zn]